MKEIEFTAESNDIAVDHVTKIFEMRTKILNDFVNAYFAGVFDNIEDLKEALPYIEMLEQTSDDGMRTTISFRINRKG